MCDFFLNPLINAKIQKIFTLVNGVIFLLTKCVLSDRYVSRKPLLGAVLEDESDVFDKRDAASKVLLR